MAHSNSSLNTFANCMAKYEHVYIKHTQPDRPASPHLEFGTMAHEVLYKAGCLRDEIRDGVDDKEYHNVIPSEVLHHNLKNEFGINNWQQYFMPIIRQVSEYERKAVDDLQVPNKNSYVIEREIKLQLTVEQLAKLQCYGIEQPVVGVIDCLIYGADWAIILDYKFSSSRKGQDEFDMNSQLPLYALLVHVLYDIPLHNIQIGYIDIPKQMFGQPTLLSNGTLSRNKSQNVSQELYEKAVIAVHGDDPYYNCKEGGYYHDCWCNLAHNKCAYLTVQYLDIEAYAGIIKDLMDAAKMTDLMKRDKLPFLKKYDSYSCKSCEFLHSCKPWLNVGGFE